MCNDVIVSFLRLFYSKVQQDAKLMAFEVIFAWIYLSVFTQVTLAESHQEDFAIVWEEDDNCLNTEGSLLPAARNKAKSHPLL